MQKLPQAYVKQMTAFQQVQSVIVAPKFLQQIARWFKPILTALQRVADPADSALQMMKLDGSKAQVAVNRSVTLVQRTSKTTAYPRMTKSLVQMESVKRRFL